MNDTRGGRLMLAAGLALAAALSSPPARAESPVAGVVVSLEGRPQVKAEGKSDYKKAKVNDMVHDGDTVKTGAGDRVGIAFVSGAEMRINENSVFTVQSGGGEKPTSVFTTLGDAWTRLISGHNGIQVRSPVAVAAVRGTEADIDVGDRMAVKVYEGLVDVSNGKGRVTLKAGQQSVVAGAGVAPAQPKAMTPADYKKWQEGLKPKDLDKSLKLLNESADKTRELNLHMRGSKGESKDVKLKFEKKK